MAASIAPYSATTAFLDSLYKRVEKPLSLLSHIVYESSDAYITSREHLPILQTALYEQARVRDLTDPEARIISYVATQYFCRPPGLIKEARTTMSRLLTAQILTAYAYELQTMALRQKILEKRQAVDDHTKKIHPGVVTVHTRHLVYYRTNLMDKDHIPLPVMAFLTQLIGNALDKGLNPFSDNSTFGFFDVDALDRDLLQTGLNPLQHEETQNVAAAVLWILDMNELVKRSEASVSELGNWIDWLSHHIWAEQQETTSYLSELSRIIGKELHSLTYKEITALDNLAITYRKEGLPIAERCYDAALSLHQKLSEALGTKPVLISWLNRAPFSLARFALMPGYDVFPKLASDEKDVSFTVVVPTSKSSKKTAAPPRARAGAGAGGGGAAASAAAPISAPEELFDVPSVTFHYHHRVWRWLSYPDRILSSDPEYSYKPEDQKTEAKIFHTFSTLIDPITTLKEYCEKKPYTDALGRVSLRMTMYGHYAGRPGRFELSQDTKTGAIFHRYFKPLKTDQEIFAADGWQSNLFPSHYPDGESTLHEISDKSGSYKRGHQGIITVFVGSDAHAYIFKRY